MNTISLSTIVDAQPVPRTRMNPPAPIHDLGEAIAEIAARLHAATHELLVLLQEFNAQAAWHPGWLSCAHWLHWRTGIDLGAAREKVRVANALPVLPVVSAAMRRGELSYAKVRAITRVATAENEASLVDLAKAGTAAHVERLVRAWRRVDRAEAHRQAEARHQARYLTTRVDDDGMVVVRGRLTPEVGAVVQRALEAAADRLYQGAASATTDQPLAPDLTPGQRRADALGLLAEVALSADLASGSTGDRYQVVLHVDAEAVTSNERPERDADHSTQRVLEVGDRTADVSYETDWGGVSSRYAAGSSVTW